MPDAIPIRDWKTSNTKAHIRRKEVLSHGVDRHQCSCKVIGTTGHWSCLSGFFSPVDPSKDDFRIVLPVCDHSMTNKL